MFKLNEGDYKLHWEILINNHCHMFSSANGYTLVSFTYRFSNNDIQ